MRSFRRPVLALLAAAAACTLAFFVPSRRPAHPPAFPAAADLASTRAAGRILLARTDPTGVLGLRVRAEQAGRLVLELPAE